MEYTKEDFYDWYNSPVTKAVISRFNDEIEELTSKLVTSAGTDPIQDARYSGVILGLRALKDTSWEDK